jgi:hypothetical protein
VWNPIRRKAVPNAGVLFRKAVPLS